MVHTFDDVIQRDGVEKVVEVHSREVNEIDIIRFYAKVLDVKARLAEIVAPSYTSWASELARAYGIRQRVMRLVQ